MEEELAANPQSEVFADQAPSPGGSSGRKVLGIGWAIAVGALSVALLVALGVVIFGWRWYSSMLDDSSTFGATVEVTPVEAGEPWFTVAEDGTGTLEGWPYGSSGSVDEEDYFFDVFEVGAVGDVAIQHVAPVYVDESTAFYVGSQPYEGTHNVSALDSVFGMSGDDPEGFTNGDLKLRIDFHKDGSRIVADKVTILPGSESAPLMY